jgi:hypothetical protein
VIGEFLIRASAAVIGGYVAVYLLIHAASLLSPLAPATTTWLFGSLYLFPWLGFAIWAFACRSVWRAWALPLAVIVLCGLGLILHEAGKPGLFP